MNDISLAVSRVIRAPRPRVFAAWTTPETLRKWWGPGPVSCPEVHVDLREGGQYRIANLEVDGSITWISGRFEEVNAPERLVYTWRVSIVPGEATLVTVEFREHPEGTEVAVRHDRFADPAVRDMHAQGWEACLEKLAALFEGQVARA
jgi:uncharacterized protein YndB with AHSA1/START domain